MFPPQHELISLNEIGFKEEIPETGTTLEENALQKAATIYQHEGHPAFADDTGLEVDALDGKPGVHTARFAGEDATDQENVRKLLNDLQREENRKARFRTVIALIMNNKEELFEGTVEGTIAHEPSGDKGFGYDPVFIPEGYDRTFAEMTLEEKNQLSHRSRAFNKFLRHINMGEVKSMRFWF